MELKFPASSMNWDTATEIRAKHTYTHIERERERLEMLFWIFLAVIVVGTPFLHNNSFRLKIFMYLATTNVPSILIRYNFARLVYIQMKQ